MPSDLKFARTSVRDNEENAMSRCLLPAIIGAVAAVSVTAGETPATLERLREVHRTRAAQLRSVLIVRTVETTYPQTDAQLERLRDRIRHRADLPLARLLEQLDEQGAGPDEVEMAVESLLGQFGDLELKADATARVARINRQRTVHERVLIDFARNRKRLEQRDARDLDKLMQEHGIAEAMRPSLDVSYTFIATPDYRIGISPDDRRATFLPASGRVPLHDDLELLGIVPVQYLSGRYPTKIEFRPDGSVRIRMHYADRDQLAAEVRLRPGPGYQATYFARYNREGKLLHEFRLSDFREIRPGVDVPFRAETFQRAGGQGAVVETHVVQRVEWNPPVDPAAFRTPPGAKILVLAPESWEGYSRRNSSRPDGRP